MFKYFNPVEIVYTNKWFSELSFYLNELGSKNPLIVTSKGNQKRLALNSKFDSKCIFSDLNVNPNFNDCKKIINFCNNQSFDLVIAIGGGSVMDLAKVAVANLSLNESDIFKLISYKNEYRNKIPSIFLPTTHGTASEVTMWGTIWNIEEKKKYSISNFDLYPKVAILDASLLLTLPEKISISTTMDALSHSFESIWNKNANKKSTKFAIEAIYRIMTHVDLLKNNPNSLSVRRELLEASTLAGLAFSNTMTASAHSMSYPLTLHFDIPHGVASSMSLLPLMDINKKFIQNELNEICFRLNLSFDDLKNKISSIPKGVFSYKLIDWGLSESDLKLVCNESFTKGRMDNNITVLNKNRVMKIFKEIYN